MGLAFVLSVSATITPPFGVKKFSVTILLLPEHIFVNSLYWLTTLGIQES